MCQMALLEIKGLKKLNRLKGGLQHWRNKKEVVAKCSGNSFFFFTEFSVVWRLFHFLLK